MKTNQLLRVTHLIVGIGVLQATDPPSPTMRDGAPKESIRLDTIRIRDPFILPIVQTRTYYLVASSGRRVVVRQSHDLKSWSEPHEVFTVPDKFWGSGAIWAQEMHSYRGKYYLFATFMNKKPVGQWADWPPRVQRGTQVLVADLPQGPFLHLLSLRNRNT